MKKIFQLAVLSASLGVPLLAAAQSGINLGAITPYSDGIINVINGILVPVLIAIAFIVFLWGIYKYFILGAANESEKAEGRKFALWSIIGFVIILSLWGIVNLVMGTLGLSVGKAPPFPTIGNYSGTAGNTGTNPFPGTGQISPGTSGTVSAQQNAAITSLNQQYTNANNICAQYGNQSSQCQSAANAYTQSSQAYSTAYPPSSSTGSTVTYQSCIDNGSPPEVCRCEASGGIWELSGGGQCSTNSASQTTEPTPVTEPAPAASTCDSGDPAICACENSGGLWSSSGACCTNDPACTS